MAPELAMWRNGGADAAACRTSSSTSWKRASCSRAEAEVGGVGVGEVREDALDLDVRAQSRARSSSLAAL